jgi:hypothetical protein
MDIPHTGFPGISPVPSEQTQDHNFAGLFELRSSKWLQGGVSMNGRVIRIPRDLYESLPQIYQVIAQIGEQSGQVVIIDENSISKIREQ